MKPARYSRKSSCNLFFTEGWKGPRETMVALQLHLKLGPLPRTRGSHHHGGAAFQHFLLHFSLAGESQLASESCDHTHNRSRFPRNGTGKPRGRRSRRFRAAGKSAPSSLRSSKWPGLPFPQFLGLSLAQSDGSGSPPQKKSGFQHPGRLEGHSRRGGPKSTVSRAFSCSFCRWLLSVIFRSVPVMVALVMASLQGTNNRVAQLRKREGQTSASPNRICSKGSL